MNIIVYYLQGIFVATFVFCLYSELVYLAKVKSKYFKSVWKYIEVRESIFYIFMIYIFTSYLGRIQGRCLGCTHVGSKENVYTNTLYNRNI